MMKLMDANRRDTIKALLAISAAGALAACDAAMPSPESSKKSASNSGADFAAPGQFLTSGEMTLLAAFAQTLIPRTQTPGAGDVGVNKTIQALLSNWGDDGIRYYWRAGLKKIAAILRGDGAAEFVTMSEAAKTASLAAYDKSVFRGNVEDGFYRDLKQTIATAYYMSEPGASEELHYDPVPGDWRADVAFSEIGKAWAT